MNKVITEVPIMLHSSDCDSEFHFATQNENIYTNIQNICHNQTLFHYSKKVQETSQ